MGQEVGSDAALAEDQPLPATLVRTPLAGAFRRFIDLSFNLGSIALVVASAVLTGGVIASHVLSRGIEWQDELEIFLVAGAVFLSAAAVQARRGNARIGVFDSLLGESGRRRWTLVTDTLSLIFVAYIAWKSGTLFLEAWAEGQVSQSTWAPPMWIPYGIMTLGLALLACELARQVRETSTFALLTALLTLAALLLWPRPVTPLLSGFTPASIGIAYCTATLAVMFSGMPIAFALGVVATAFMILFMPRPRSTPSPRMSTRSWQRLSLKARDSADPMRDETSISRFTPGSIASPAASASQILWPAVSSRRWRDRRPPLARQSGPRASPRCASAAIRPGLASGIIAAGGTLGILLPPSVTMLLYAVAAEVSLGKLFLAGIGPGLLLIVLFAAYAAFRFRHEREAARSAVARGGKPTAILDQHPYTMRDKLLMLAWVTPFVTILAGVMIVLYAGLATPSETAGVGAILALRSCAGLKIARIWRYSAAQRRRSSGSFFVCGMAFRATTRSAVCSACSIRLNSTPAFLSSCGNSPRRSRELSP